MRAAMSLGITIQDRLQPMIHSTRGQWQDMQLVDLRPEVRPDGGMREASGNQALICEALSLQLLASSMTCWWLQQDTD